MDIVTMNINNAFSDRGLEVTGAVISCIRNHRNDVREYTLVVNMIEGERGTVGKIVKSVTISPEMFSRDILDDIHETYYNWATRA